jgi:hypothetical protein
VVENAARPAMRAARAPGGAGRAGRAKMVSPALIVIGAVTAREEDVRRLALEMRQ